MPLSVLVVEDDIDLARNLCDFLEIKGYLPDHAGDVTTAKHLLGSESYDLVVLDVSLPGGSGIGLCKTIRHELRQSTPIVMLTAKDDLDTKLDAFDLGADDYIVKPAALREIEVRIRALIRRARREVDNDSLVVADLQMDTGSLRVERAGQLISLPPVPLRILRLLMANSPNVVLHSTIQREIWGDDPLDDKHGLIVHMHTLRNAVDRPFTHPLIHTVRGFGYRIADAEN
ncbi:MAG TPA: response regulator transcription factor [Rhodocyclaceae bacterium]|nr:response regulator transcription factor [Rhodocyclaceae bacterium]